MTRKIQIILGLLIFVIGASVGTLVSKMFFPVALAADYWTRVDSVVETFVKAEGGSIVGIGSSSQGDPPEGRFKNWTIAIPQMDLDQNVLQMKVRFLTDLLTDLDPGLRGGGASRSDPIIYEDSSHPEEVRFRSASGPGLRCEIQSIGRTGVVFLEARGLTRNDEGLGGYTSVVNVADIEEGRKAIILELKIVKWR